jgi:2-oxoglutarate dehydrogenase E2 component (dihydrolipoamide succinyltransferase)
MSTNIVVPELGESVVEARVARWLKKEGDAVNAGDALVELETEKIDLEVSADRAGVLSSIKHAEGADVKVGEVLAVLDAAAAGAAAVTANVPTAPAPAATATATAPADVKATPTARNVAREEGVKLESIAPAAGSRVKKGDVLRASQAPGARPQEPGPRPQESGPRDQAPGIRPQGPDPRPQV